MDKTLTYCKDCAYWHPSNDPRIKEEYRGCVGYCNKPYESIVERDNDDFCSRGYKITIMDTKRED